MEKKKILSGITSTGKLTIGNYIGAIKQFIQLQDGNMLIAFIANLHGITLPINSKVLKDNILEMAKLYYACGLKFDENIIFVQSDVLEHSQLAYIILCNTTIGELNRMTQFKDKSNNVKASNNTNYIPTGILTYPTLMAADILLYNPDLIPVGEDQKQHIELTRNIAIRMNEKYGQMFQIPEPYITKQGQKIMDLQKPDKKMSKSSINKKSYILLLDKPNDVIKKINSAVTDSENKIYYDKKNKPGISNLMIIYSSLSNKKLEDIEKEFENKNYGDFKKCVAETINNKLKLIQEKFYKCSDQKIIKMLNDGAKKAQMIAKKNLNNVQEKIGIEYKN